MSKFYTVALSPTPFPTFNMIIIIHPPIAKLPPVPNCNLPMLRHVHLQPQKKPILLSFSPSPPTPKMSIASSVRMKPLTIRNRLLLRSKSHLSPLISKPKPKPLLRPITSLFTGIVEEMGEVRRLGPSPDGDGGFDIEISARTVLSDVSLGDSIAVEGTCLTVTRFDPHRGLFSVGVSQETLRKTSLRTLRVGSPVNLERALLPTSRMGGHIVQGHVDGTGEILEMVPEGNSLWVRVAAGRDLLRLIVPKGFVAVDGSSLTVVNVDDEEGWFDFMLVAYTQQKVVIPRKKVGEKVNIEVDVLGKYIERLLNARPDVKVVGGS